MKIIIFTLHVFFHIYMGLLSNLVNVTRGYPKMSIFSLINIWEMGGGASTSCIYMFCMK